MYGAPSTHHPCDLRLPVSSLGGRFPKCSFFRRKKLHLLGAEARSGVGPWRRLEPHLRVSGSQDRKGLLGRALLRLKQGIIQQVCHDALSLRA